MGLMGRMVLRVRVENSLWQIFGSRGGSRDGLPGRQARGLRYKRNIATYRRGVLCNFLEAKYFGLVNKF